MNNPKRGVQIEKRPSINLGVKMEDLPRLKKSDIDELKDLFKKFDRTNTGSVGRNEMIEIFRGIQGLYYITI